MTKLLDRTLKCIDKFRLNQYIIPSTISMITASKKPQKNVSHISIINNKDTRTTFGASIVNSEHILHFILLLILSNSDKKVLVGSQKRLFQKINLFSLTVRNILSYELEKLRLYVFIFIQKIVKKYIFMTALQKDESNPEH